MCFRIHRAHVCPSEGVTWRHSIPFFIFFLCFCSQIKHKKQSKTNKEKQIKRSWKNKAKYQRFSVNICRYYYTFFYPSDHFFIVLALHTNCTVLIKHILLYLYIFFIISSLYLSIDQFDLSYVFFVHVFIHLFIYLNLFLLSNCK